MIHPLSYNTSEILTSLKLMFSTFSFSVESRTYKTLSPWTSRFQIQKFVN